MTGQMSGGEGDIHQKILKKVGIDQEGDLEGETGKDGKIEMKMNITEAETGDQIREETGVMKKKRLMKECNDVMREIVDKGGIMMTGNLKTIEDVIVIEIGAAMTEENTKTGMIIIMIEELIVTEERGMTLKEIENRDHQEEETMKKEEKKEGTVLMTEEAEDLVIEVEVKGKIGNKMMIVETVDKVEDLGVQQKTGEIK